MESCGTFFSMITKLSTHSVTSLTGSRIPNCSKFQISLWKTSCKWIGTLQGACLTGFCIWFELELVKFTRKLPNSSENVRVHIKDSLLCQWSSLHFIQFDADLFGISPLNHLGSFISTINWWTNMQFCFLLGSCRLCGWHFWIFLELAGISCQIQSNKALLHQGCKNHPSKAS